MFSKFDQLHHSRRIHRNPEKLRQFLGLRTPINRLVSEAQRYEKCSHPKCGHIGTLESPLDLHHIIPRSQSKYLINSYENHLYLCGDFFPKNHHKALHGESTPGLADWQALGFFGEWVANDECETPKGVDGAGERLVALAKIDKICLALAKKDVNLAYDYAIKKGVFIRNTLLSPKDNSIVVDFVKNNQ